MALTATLAHSHISVASGRKHRVITSDAFPRKLLACKFVLCLRCKPPGNMLTVVIRRKAVTLVHVQKQSLCFETHRAGNHNNRLRKRNLTQFMQEFIATRTVYNQLTGIQKRRSVYLSSSQEIFYCNTVHIGMRGNGIQTFSKARCFFLPISLRERVWRAKLPTAVMSPSKRSKS